MSTNQIIYEYSISPQKRRGLRNSCIYKAQPIKENGQREKEKKIVQTTI